MDSKRATSSSSEKLTPAQAAQAAQEEWTKRSNLWSSMVPEYGMQLPKDFDINDPEFRKNVRVEIGPPMTAEQFEKWQAERRKSFK